jgi:hypothetical protein
MLKKLIDDSVLGWNAAAFTLNLTDMDLLVKISVGIAVFLYTSIKIYKELNGQSTN